jgi:hypothetical protein
VDLCHYSPIRQQTFSPTCKESHRVSQQYATVICGQTSATRVARGNPQSLLIKTPNWSVQHPNCKNLSHSDIPSVPIPPSPQARDVFIPKVCRLTILSYEQERYMCSNEILLECVILNLVTFLCRKSSVSKLTGFEPDDRDSIPNRDRNVFSLPRPSGVHQASQPMGIKDS